MEKTTIIVPLEIYWEPKEDITTYELAMCIPFFNRKYPPMPYEVDISLPHLRHFRIIDHNKVLKKDEMDKTSGN